MERGPRGEGVVPTPLVLRDEERSSEAQDTGKGTFPEDVGEEHGDDGGGEVVWVAVDMRALGTRQRGQGGKGGAAMGGRAQVSVLALYGSCMHVYKPAATTMILIHGSTFYTAKKL